MKVLILLTIYLGFGGLICLVAFGISPREIQHQTEQRPFEGQAYLSKHHSAHEK